MIERIHTSEVSVGSVTDDVQDTEPARKPRGLWYAEGTSWLKFCALGFRERLYENHYEVVLAPDANILVLDSDEDYATFLAEFGNGEKAGFGDPWNPYGKDVSLIHWNRVAMRYDGIECRSPRARNGYWLGYWDVTSGCVWNSKAIVRLTPLEILIQQPPENESWRPPTIGEPRRAGRSRVRL